MLFLFIPNDIIFEKKEIFSEKEGSGSVCMYSLGSAYSYKTIPRYLLSPQRRSERYNTKHSIPYSCYRSLNSIGAEEEEEEAAEDIMQQDWPRTYAHNECVHSHRQ